MIVIMNNKLKVFAALLCLFAAFLKTNAQEPSGAVKVEGAEGLYVSQYDEPNTMTRADAIRACYRKGEGWHLPSLMEMSLARQEILSYGMRDDWYWTTSSATKMLHYKEYNPVMDQEKDADCSSKRVVRCFWSKSDAKTAVPVQQKTVAAESKAPVAEKQDAQESVPVQQKTVATESKAPVAEKQNVQESAPEQQNAVPKQVAETQDSYTLASDEPAAEYKKNSVGVVLGNMQALSLKFIRNEHFGIELDLGMWYSISSVQYYAAGFNLNFTGVWNFTPNLFGFAGGGISFGYNVLNDWSGETSDIYDLINQKYFYFWHMHNWGKAGTNAIVGVEYRFADMPLALSFDFRPGVAFLFDGYDCFSSPFDWALNIGVHYTF